MTDLTTYVPEVRQLEIAGKTVTVTPLKVRQIPAFTRAIGPAGGALVSGNLMAAVAVHGEDLIQAMAVATGEPAEWIGELDADEFLRLVGEVMEVNADFFVHRVAPTLNATLDRMMQAMDGVTPSPSSSLADSAGATIST